MAFISDPKVLGPYIRYARKTKVQGIGVNVWEFVDVMETVKEIKVQWVIDNAGGESPPLTYDFGGETYDIETAGPELSYWDYHGLYTAIYTLTSEEEISESA